MIYHYYPFVDGAKTGENSNNIKLYYFKHQDPGAFVSISGGGVLASSKHQQQAQAFIKWITGKQGGDPAHQQRLRIRRRRRRGLQPETGAAERSGRTESRCRAAEQ